MKIAIHLALWLILAALLSACAERLAPAPEPPTVTPPVEAAISLADPDLARGQQVFLDKQCAACHGPAGEGGIGGPLAGTTLTFDRFVEVLRNALPPKPSFSEVELTTQDSYNVYGWLQSLEKTGASPGQPASTLAGGQVLGMTVWTQHKCDTCHGAFAQGSPTGPALAGLNFPYEMERARMRQTADTILEHAAGHMDDAMLQRLYKWLQAGARPGEGC
jgi:mono/diheme cytochrome c family protein